MHFICPLCHEPLTATVQGLTCSSLHHFDRAREGYFNLLPAQYKNSREPGDAKIQLQARRKFLNAGYFAQLLPKLFELLPPQPATLLDIGCGEGYFTRSLEQHLGAGADVYGIDIAKSGVLLAVKAGAGQYAVASSAALPIADNSMDVVTRIYAPSNDAELRRVLAPGGQVVIVSPGENHLLGLRERIYAHVRPHQPPATPECMHLVQSQQSSFPITIPAGEMTAALLQMTPFMWRLSDLLKQQLIDNGIEDQADFLLSVYTLQPIP